MKVSKVSEGQAAFAQRFQVFRPLSVCRGKPGRGLDPPTWMR